jgi:hypothetical protein
MSSIAVQHIYFVAASATELCATTIAPDAIAGGSALRSGGNAFACARAFV